MLVDAEYGQLAAKLFASPEKSAIDRFLCNSQVRGDLAVSPPLAVFQKQNLRIARGQPQHGLARDRQSFPPHQRKQRIGRGAIAARALQLSKATDRSPPSAELPHISSASNDRDAMQPRRDAGRASKRPALFERRQGHLLPNLFDRLGLARAGKNHAPQPCLIR
jgi:hypothetical protein